MTKTVKKKTREAQFQDNLEELYTRTGIQQRTVFAEFLGVTYQAYCNWRSGAKYPSNKLTEYAVDVYLMLSDKELKALVVQRLEN